MDDGYSLISIVIILASLILNAILYGFGAAIQNVNGAKLEEKAESGDAQAKRLLQIAGHPRRFVLTLLVITDSLQMAVGFGIWRRLTVWMESGVFGQFTNGNLWIRPASVVISAVVILLLFVPFGILIPKELGLRDPIGWSERLLGIVEGLMFLTTPVTGLISGATRLVLKIWGVDIDKDVDNVTEEDIKSMVNEGHEQGVLEADEAEMITNIFELDEKTAEDVMTHRKNLVALDCSLTLREALDFILKEGSNSRYPVYREEIDDIIGVLHMRDAVVFFEQEEYKDRSLDQIPRLLREPHFIPETRNLDNLFREMQSQKIHMEIVVDEYGQTVGIVTMEDILEEIVGNIMDEYDVEEELIAAEEDGSFLMSGMASLDQVAKILELSFEEGEEVYDTINGFLISRLGRIPKDGEEPVVTCLGYEFRILKVENKMIQSVRAFPCKEEQQTEEKTER